MTLPGAFVATLIAFVGLDFLWLGKMGDLFYRPALGGMALDGFRLAPALVFYLLYAAGTVFFAVRPGLEAENFYVALGHGAFFGLVAYGVYDLTNQATLKIWPVTLTLVDMSWGAVLTALAAGAGWLAGRAFGS